MLLNLMSETNNRLFSLLCCLQIATSDWLSGSSIILLRHVLFATRVPYFRFTIRAFKICFLQNHFLSTKSSNTTMSFLYVLNTIIFAGNFEKCLTKNFYYNFDTRCDQHLYLPLHKLQQIIKDKSSIFSYR